MTVETSRSSELPVVSIHDWIRQDCESGNALRGCFSDSLIGDGSSVLRCPPKFLPGVQLRREDITNKLRADSQVARPGSIDPTFKQGSAVRRL